MEISTEIGSLYRLGDFEQIFKTLKHVGFTAYDFSMGWENAESMVILADDYLDQAREIRNIADRIGIKCNQSHAPLTRERLGEYEYGERGEELLRRAIEISGVLGAKVCVIHQQKLCTAQQNAVFFKKFETVARDNNVKIGLENLWNWDSEADQAKIVACSTHDDFKRHLELLPRDVFVGCVDIGHAEMKGLNTNAVSIIDALGDRLEAMHLHDNNKRYDLHMMPFTMSIDFEEIINALKRNNYTGDITFETDKYINKFPIELIPSVLAQLVEIAKYFINKLSS